MGSLKDTSVTLSGCRRGTSNCLASASVSMQMSAERLLETCDVCVCSTHEHDRMDDSTNFRPERVKRPLVAGFSTVTNPALVSFTQG